MLGVTAEGEGALHASPGLQVAIRSSNMPGDRSRIEPDPRAARRGPGWTAAAIPIRSSHPYSYRDGIGMTSAGDVAEPAAKRLATSEIDQRARRDSNPQPSDP
jgi:hypothetical protein